MEMPRPPGLFQGQEEGDIFSDEMLDLLSAREPRGTAPVRQTTTRPRVSCAKPRDRAKYCSTTNLASVLIPNIMLASGPRTVGMLVIWSEQ